MVLANPNEELTTGTVWCQQIRMRSSRRGKYGASKEEPPRGGQWRVGATPHLANECWLVEGSHYRAGQYGASGQCRDASYGVYD